MAETKCNGREKYNLVVGSSFLIIMIGGTFVGGIFYDIKPSTIMTISYLFAIIFLGIGKLIFKEEPRPLPPPSKENIIRSWLAIYSAVFGVAVILELAIGFHLICYLEKAGNPASISDFLLVLFVIPSVFLCAWLKLRSKLIRRYN